MNTFQSFLTLGQPLKINEESAILTYVLAAVSTVFVRKVNTAKEGKIYITAFERKKRMDTVLMFIDDRKSRSSQF